jgi:hypothetical protein
MRPILQRGQQADQTGPVAQERAQVTDGLRCDPGLGEQVGAQQLREGARIDLVVLEPGRRDRLAAAGMDQVRFQAELLQQLDQPAPAVGGLECDRGAPRKGTQDRGQLRRVVWDVAVALLVAGIIDDGDLRALAVHVHADVHTHQGPPSLGSSIPEAYGCRAEQGTGSDLQSVSSRRWRRLGA